MPETPIQPRKLLLRFGDVRALCENLARAYLAAQSKGPEVWEYFNRDISSNLSLNARPGTHAIYNRPPVEGEPVTVAELFERHAQRREETDP